MKVDTKAIVRYQGSEDCLVRIQLSPEQVQRVRSAWKIAEDSPIRWLHSEIYAQGGGWYEIMSRDGYVDGALRGLVNLRFALFGYETSYEHFSNATFRRIRHIRSTPVVMKHMTRRLDPRASWEETRKPLPVDPAVAVKRLQQHFGTMH